MGPRLERRVGEFVKRGQSNREIGESGCSCSNADKTECHARKQPDGSAEQSPGGHELVSILGLRQIGRLPTGC